ncbi:MAG: MATE family efflux transporter [Flavobacteriales bacterium]
MHKSTRLGIEPIKTLLFEQAIPASIGVLAMSIYMLVDSIFVGKWVGSLGIGAIAIVMPIVFFISSIGMGIGIGGSSIISRALGAEEKRLAQHTFGNQITMTLILSLFVVTVGYFYTNDIVYIFGGKEDLHDPSFTYFNTLLYGIPFLALNMMANAVIRAEGQAKTAMVVMLIPAILNIILDILFIKVLNGGLEGAAWATVVSYIVCFVFILYYFIFGKGVINIRPKYFPLDLAIVSEISSLGFVTVVRQSVIALLSIILNFVLFKYGNEIAIIMYGILGRVIMFALFPVMGVTQGFLPISGYNYGAKNYERVKESIKVSIYYATLFSFFIFTLIMFFAPEIVMLFTTKSSDNLTIIKDTSEALRWGFAAVPIIAFQLIGAAYFQAIGKPRQALLLTLLKQGFFLIPLVLILPNYLGLFGVWISFPIADILSTMVTAWFLRKEMKKLDHQDEETHLQMTLEKIIKEEQFMNR